VQLETVGTEDSGGAPAVIKSPSIWQPALKEAGWAFLASAMLLAIIYALAFSRIHPEFVPFIGHGAKPLIASGNDLLPVSVGKGRKESGRYLIEDFNGDEAILALPRTFRAEDYPFIKVNLKGFTRYSKAKILWQQVGDPTTHGLEFNRSGDQVTQIAMVYGGEHYSGPIQSIALLFFDGPALGFENNDHVDITINSIEFRPFSAKFVIEQIVEDWTNPPLWQGYSNNIVRGYSCQRDVVSQCRRESIGGDRPADGGVVSACQKAALGHNVRTSASRNGVMFVSLWLGV
jgi:hypothetical protein